MVYRRLLVPLDGSSLGEAVMPLVERFATATGADVTLLHILERGAPEEVHGQRHLQSVAEAEAYLAGQAAILQKSGIPVEYHAHPAPEGDVARSIVQHAEEEKADLIILCTHGGGGVRQLLFGSIAQQVLNRGATQVLLVRPAPDGSAPPFAPERLLVPLDATGAAEAALAPAFELARALGASLHLVMVVPTGPTVAGERPVAPLLPATTRAVLNIEERRAAEYLEGLAADLGSGDVPVTVEVRRGRAPSRLAEEAAEPGVGLVVVATHGRAGLQAIWAGSVTARLLARTRGPVLLLRTVES